MNKKLAIKGHSTRGKEVIEILEMMGGKNNCDNPADNLGLCYLIGNEFDICAHYFGYDDYEDGELNIFTLEEFLKKYPFKVGDKVVYTKFGDNCDDYPVTIESMKWTGTTIEYTFNDCVTCLAKDLKMWNGEPDAVISGIYLNSCDYADEVELNLGDYEIEVRDGRTYAVKKKPKYPKLTNLTECKEILGEKDIYQSVSGYKGELLTNFQRLFIFRDAYWKIVGEEMGLGKPWEPKHEYDEEIFFIYCDRANGINKGQGFPTDSFCLTFPTKEMRDTFYENFKDLIEQCKELL